MGRHEMTAFCADSLVIPTPMRWSLRGHDGVFLRAGVGRVLSCQNSNAAALGVWKACGRCLLQQGHVQLGFVNCAGGNCFAEMDLTDRQCRLRRLLEGCNDDGAVMLALRNAPYDMWPDLATITKLIARYAKTGNCARALAVYNSLHVLRLQPDVTVSNSALWACERAGNAGAAWTVYSAMLRWGIVPDSISYKALLTCLANTGHWRQCLKVSSPCSPVSICVTLCVYWYTSSCVLLCCTDNLSCLFHTACNLSYECVLTSGPCPCSVTWWLSRIAWLWMVHAQWLSSLHSRELESGKLLRHCFSVFSPRSLRSHRLQQRCAGKRRHQRTKACATCCIACAISPVQILRLKTVIHSRMVRSIIITWLPCCSLAKSLNMPITCSSSVESCGRTGVFEAANGSRSMPDCCI